MIGRLRLRVGIYTSAIMLLISMALALSATETITRSQAESLIDQRIAAAGILVIGAFWVLVTWINGNTKAALSGSISRLEKAVSDLTDLMQQHHLDPLAHPVGSANRIDPINLKLDKMGTVLSEVHERTAVLVSGQTTAVAELAEQETRLGVMEKSLTQLLAEHCLLHGEYLRKRAGDNGSVDPTKLRGTL